MGDSSPPGEIEGHASDHQSIHQLLKAGDLKGVYSILTNRPADSAYLHQLLSEVDEKGEPASLCAARAAATAGCALILDCLWPSIKCMIDEDPQAGRSIWHIAAAHGYVNVVQSLLNCNVSEAVWSHPDENGNTPLCLAVLLGHDHVAKLLVEAIMSLYKNRASTGMPPIDANGRSILHYAAQFSTDRDALKKLISETGAEMLKARDKQGDSFLHAAATAGNPQVLQAIKELGLAHDVAIKELISSENDPLHSPGLLALFHNQREFFEELVRMGKVEITLGSITKRLIAELIFDHPEIEDRLGVFGITLPTYLALFAEKDFVFDFLLESKFLKISQCDHKHNRTCLLWAVVDGREDIVKKLSKRVDLSPEFEDRDRNTAMQLAFENKKYEMMRILAANPDFKYHEEKLQRDREIYVQVLNATLVGAALIVSVTFAGWLQLPSGALFKSMGMKVFWASNSVSFYTAVATMCVTILAMIPTPKKYVAEIVRQLRVAIVIDATLLAVSIAAVTVAFAAAGFAALPPVAPYKALMRGTTGAGGYLCTVVWFSFLVHLYRCAPSLKSSVLTLLRFVPAVQKVPGWSKVTEMLASTSAGESWDSEKWSGRMNTDLVAHRATKSENVPGHDQILATDVESHLRDIRQDPDAPGKKEQFTEDIYKEILKQKQIKHQQSKQAQIAAEQAANLLSTAGAAVS